MRQNASAARALPRTPLGELTAFPRLPSWIWGGEREGGAERDKDGKGTEEGKGRGRVERGKGMEFRGRFGEGNGEEVRKRLEMERE